MVATRTTVSASNLESALLVIVVAPIVDWSKTGAWLTPPPGGYSICQAVFSFLTKRASARRNRRQGAAQIGNGFGPPPGSHSFPTDLSTKIANWFQSPASLTLPCALPREVPPSRLGPGVQTQIP